MSWRVLCLCDSPVALLLYESILELSGFRVLPAPNFKVGLRVIRSSCLDYAVLEKRSQLGSSGKLRCEGLRVPMLFVVTNGDVESILLRCRHVSISQEVAIGERP